MRGSLTLTSPSGEGIFAIQNQKILQRRTGWAIEMEIELSTQPCSAGRNGSVLAYFISHHELSTLKKAPSRSNSSSRSKGSNHRPDPVTLGIGFSVSLLATDDGKRDARFGVSQVFKKMRLMTGEFLGRRNPESRMKEFGWV